ncbi:MAG: hypothetical protein CMM54_06425 [Rhodospirillaceae bacterium]|nr:hypothetical protein [Rhodospirillaceae bacterium]
MFSLVAAILLTGSLGSIHAFSIFIEPFELAFNASRESVSLVYSAALTSLTVAVLVSHWLFRLASAATIFALVGLTSALGLSLPMWLEDMLWLYIGYGLIFGFANGLGYALALQLAARSYPTHAATAMGGVTAIYALGALALARIFNALIVDRDHDAGLAVAAVVMLIVSLVGTLVTYWSGTKIEAANQNKSVSPSPGWVKISVLLWLGYSGSAFAGLMVIGHAASIATTAGSTIDQAGLAVMLVSFGSAVGGIVAGVLADRLSLRWIVALVALISATSLGVLGFAWSPTTALVLLVLVGFGYGATIVLYPAITLFYFGPSQMARHYGQVFTAWGVAGLIAPWTAGRLYDLTGDYTSSCLVATGVALIAAVTAIIMPRRGLRQET